MRITLVLIIIINIIKDFHSIIIIKDSHSIISQARDINKERKRPIDINTNPNTLNSNVPNASAFNNMQNTPSPLYQSYESGTPPPRVGSNQSMSARPSHRRMRSNCCCC